MFTSIEGVETTRTVRAPEKARLISVWNSVAHNFPRAERPRRFTVHGTEETYGAQTTVDQLHAGHSSFKVYPLFERFKPSDFPLTLRVY